MKLYFVEAARPLTKTLGPSVTVGEFLPKRVTSEELEIPDSLSELLNALNEHRSQGLIKGHLTRALVNESRAGAMDASSRTNFIILDIDGARFDNPEALMAHMGLEQLQFIWRPSASFGVVDQNGHPIKHGLRGHIYLMLTQPTSPEQQKSYLKHLNLTYFADQISLTSSNHSVEWVIDPCMAEATRLVFLSDPIVQEPWVDTIEDRSFVLYSEGRSMEFLSSTLLNTPEVHRIPELFQERFKALRKAKGLKTKKFNQDIIRNPDPNTISYIKTERGFCYYNVGIGDSGSYYHPEDNCKTMYTFKDEPPFLFEKADPDAYHQALERMQRKIREDTGRNCRYLVFRDYLTDTHYSAEYDLDEEALSIWPTAKQNLEDFMLARATPMPQPIPQIELVFRPDQDFVIERTPRGVIQRVNSYRHSTYDKLVPLGDAPPELNYETIYRHTAREFPAIHSLLHHVLGEDEASTAWTLNLLAYCVQTRKKPQTALVIAGAPGTGKDTLIDHVFAPCFGGENYVFRTTLQDLSSQFNRWAISSRLVVVSEARQSDLKGEKHAILSNNLKEWITNPTIAVRAMYRDTTQAKNFSTFVLLSNHYDVLKIGEGDRRFTVPPRQTVPLTKRSYPLAGTYDFSANKDIAYERLIEDIDNSMERFIRFLKAYEVDAHAVMTPLENDAKIEMKQASLSTFEHFLERLMAGDFDFFLEFVLDDPTVNEARDVHSSILNVRNAVRVILRQVLANLGSPIGLNRDQMLLLWCLVSAEPFDKQSPGIFSRRLIRNGVVLRPRRNILGAPTPELQQRGLTVTWNSQTPGDIAYQLLGTPNGDTAPDREDTGSATQAVH